ncbi:serine-rich adhesin for platelets-like [Cataglyphis hispanica]|uniref:serine-rich adhesin for platelets-like n=1 Tax=Cataglyphis hispanica TaxID=1086592 RepID=UPI00217FF265|nr:serine-rich adhesin for platelets-like [Cataglyphis hispanica]
MPRKENTKAKTWERDRRNRMNTYFKTLADLLPPHQEGRKLNKVDILIHATKYIKELHNRTEELFSSHASEAHKEELVRLKKLVTQLMSRTQLLSTLLKEAGISIPAEPALEKISPLKWSNKFNVDDVDKYFDKIEEKKTVGTKKKEKSVENKVPSKRKSVTSSATKKLSEETADKNVCNSIENQENRVNCANSKNYNSDSTSSIAETDLKETGHCHNDSINEATTTGRTNTKKKPVEKKIESQKALKKKSKRKDKKKSPVASTVTNLTPNTLIFSDGKLMPLVAPMTSNIIVNTQQAPTNPIILSSTQQNQMIVMQPLANRVQNSVVSICNHALINTMQKVTLNTVPAIHANMVVDSHSSVSNVKNIINATKIGGHKGILPKSKDITKTTMTYKMPIPAIHKEKLEKPKDNAIKKESEIKKSCKNHSKIHKSVPNTEENIERKSSKENSVKVQEDATVRKAAFKRTLSAESDSADEPEDKKRKDTNDEINITQPIVSKASDFTITCKSIESLKYVIEKIGENIRDENVIAKEKESNVMESNGAITQVANDVSHEKMSETDKLINTVDTNCLERDKETIEDNVTSETVVSDKYPNELHETDRGETDQSSNNFNVSIDDITEKNDENAENLNAKSTLTDIDVAEKAAGSDEPKKTCNLGKRFDNLLRATTAKEQQQTQCDTMCTPDSNKIILNLDTNTTTTMKSDASANIVDTMESVPISSSSSSTSSSSLSSSSSLLSNNVINDEGKLTKISKDEISKSLSYTSENTFVPISNRTDGLHSDLSNDIFASLQVPSSSHNSESISPTAAFLMSFPLVSSLNGKTEVLDEEMKEDFKYHSQTPPMLLQIGTIEPNSFKIKTSSPSHAIAEKRLKACEEKQVASTNTDIAPVECTTKALPKVMSEETLREPYKIVQTVLTSNLEKPVTTTSAFFSHTSVNFTVDSSCISSSLANQSRPDQLTTTNTLNSANIVSSQASQVNISASTDKNNIVDCVSQATINHNPDVTYSGASNFLPNYSVSNSLATSQHTPSSSVYKNAIMTQNPNITSIVSRIETTDNSQNLLDTRLDCATVTTNSSSATLRSFQVDYSDQGKNKDSQNSSHITYPSHSKVALINSGGIVSDHRVDYANQIDRSLPTSQSLPNYSTATKECSLPTFSSQDMQPVYNQAKDSHVLLDLNNSQQTFDVNKKQEHIIASSHNDYVQAKTISQKDSISYTNNETNEATSTSSRNQNYVTKAVNQENPFQRSYIKLSKSTDTSDNPNQADQKTKLNGVLSSKSQEQQQRHNHIRDSTYVPAKKVDVDSFVQSFQYDVKETMNNSSDRTNVLNTDNTHNNYVSYTNSKDNKKTNAVVSANTMANSNKLTAMQQNVVPRYSQQTSSNYEQSTMTENHAKSTTTVAHNSSNFSILSWTTFSPVSGSGGGSGSNNNNNLMHFEQVQPHSNENTEAKAICESYNYIPLHKENASFPNQLISDDYPTVSTGIDKLRQGKIEQQKQSFVDTSKTRNDPSKQPNRMQNPQTGNDYKFSDSGKSKNKYSMDSDYNMQNEYNTGMSQQSQQHGPKNHQNLSSKQEKIVYTYEPHNFDLAESNVQMKYSIEAYTGANFKYGEKTTQQPNQQKYQTLTQGQISVLPHDNGSYNSSDVKHSQQQQQQQSHSNNNSNKSKSNQHPQHAVKAPVNWMMTPEIKHNSSNIADIILPPIGKELEFCQNNLFTQTPAYNQGTPNQFYNNYDAATAHSFPNLPVLQSDPKRSAETFYSDEQPFPWSPTKNNVHNSVEHVIGQSSIKCIDQHIVPSSLQSLVSDLDLSANLTEKQNFLFATATPSSRISTEQSKDTSTKEKEASNVSGRDLHAILNTQNAQHSASTFLSVSQLVEHEKAEKNHQQQSHQQHHQHHHPHQHSQQQQQQQARKHQRKNNTSPRTTSKRQMDIRKSTTTNDNLHQRHEEQKSSGPVFTEQNYQQPQQQQKYQQNNVHWRSRNCKSNYTAEALIGTSVHDAGSHHQDKHASIKFTTNYPQNKFQNGLSATAAVDATVMPINYFSSAPPPDDGTATGYSQSMVNQNFNTYAYSSNSANSIYPTGNFITSISTNTSNSYIGMQLHENTTDYTVQEANSFLLPNMGGTSSSSTANTSSANTISTTANANGKTHQHYGKHPNCDKRSYSTAAKKGKRKSGLEAGPMQNLAEFPLSGINSPLEDYHHHSATFLPPPPPPPPHTNPLYQNHPQTNVYAKTVNGLPPPPPSAMSAQSTATVGATSFSMNSNMVRGGIVSSNPMAMPHHPSGGTSLTNFNLTTIFPEMNDKVTGYKPSNGIPSGLSQTASNQTASYTQRTNYPSNSLCHLPQPCL